jgi:hypothetical protein
VKTGKNTTGVIELFDIPQSDDLSLQSKWREDFYMTDFEVLPFSWSLCCCCVRQKDKTKTKTETNDIQIQMTKTNAKEKRE